MKMFIVVLALILLSFSACSAPATPAIPLEADSTPTLVIPASTTVPASAPRTPTVPLAQHVIVSELGTGLALPAEWNIVRRPGVVLLGPGLDENNSIERTWIHIGTNGDVPLAIAELSEVMASGMRDVAHIQEFTTTRIKVGGFDAVAIWWKQNVPRDPNVPEYWLDVHVPAFGVVHNIVFHPVLLSPDGKQLKAMGQAILDSIRFSLSSSVNGAPFGLGVEEHALKSAPELESRSFVPVEGTHSEIMKKRESLREEPAPLAGKTLVAIGDDKYVASIVPTSAGQKVAVQVTRNGKPAYTVTVGDTSPITNLRGLYAYGGHWVLEVTHTDEKKNPAKPNEISYDVWGEIIQDGVSLNKERGYEEAFGVQVIEGKLFHFFKRKAAPSESHYGISYGGRSLDLGYAGIPHYGCCSAAALDPHPAKSMVEFFAQRSGNWYYVEVGAFN